MDKNSKLLNKINFTESYTSYNVLTFLPEPTYDLTMLQKNNEVLSLWNLCARLRTGLLVQL